MVQPYCETGEVFNTSVQRRRENDGADMVDGLFNYQTISSYHKKTMCGVAK